MTLLASSGSAWWFLTRGSGVVTLALLSASVCLGVLTSIRWRSTRVPRFLVSGLHRNISLLAVVFLAVHVVTTLLDAYAPIHLLDAFVPFLSPYRPIWLGLGALSCDLVVAVVVTSLLRVRLGHRTWRTTHWLAYASWPLALVHSLGTGSDARTGWLAVLAFTCVGAVTLALCTRFLHGRGDLTTRSGLAGTVLALPVVTFLWYQSGPGRPGWAAKAGTPTALISSVSNTSGSLEKRIVTKTPSPNQLPSTFSGRVTGDLAESDADAQGLVTLHIDSAVRGGLQGTLRIALRGFPTDGGGVTMTSSGVAFAAKGTPVFEGSIVALNGTNLSAEVTSSSGGTYRLALDLDVDSITNTVSGTVSGRRA
jgi:sulfoxide reductase heme-binding subunit YedZ